MEIILATASPYRIRAFSALGIPFTAEDSGVDEKGSRPENPEQLVLHLARLKAEAVAKNNKDSIVIGFDSIGWFNNQVLEKPESRDELASRLRMLSGKSYDFITGVHMIGPVKTLSKVVKTKVLFRKLKDEEIEKYAGQDEHYNTFAVGYDPWDHISASFPEKIEGSYHNHISGIPLEAIVEMLHEIDANFGIT